MFTPLHLLPQFNGSDRNKYQDRWRDHEGPTLRDKILQMIREGAGEDFLQIDFERGNLGFLENMWDLKGIDIFKEEIDFPKSDNFEAIDFSYASFHHSKFKNATFYSSHFFFTRIYNCEFVDCIFGFTEFYGSNFEKVRFINCDFIEYNKTTNCDLKEVTFENCFMPKKLFFDCKFDERTEIGIIRHKSKTSNLELNKSDLADIYKGIKEGYRAGDVIKQARVYFFKERQSITRHNTKGRGEKIAGYLLEYTLGYGIKPIRVLQTMLALFVLFSTFFILKVGISDGLLLSAGAFFTFGANLDYLQKMGAHLKILYVVEVVFGISIMSIFIVVLTNLWFNEK